MNARREGASADSRVGPHGRLILAMIRGYQLVISPLLGPYCRHLPSCSSYCHEAIERFGVSRGGWLAAKRVMRCHPWGTHGYDPVPERWPR